MKSLFLIKQIIFGPWTDSCRRHQQQPVLEQHSVLQVLVQHSVLHCSYEAFSQSTPLNERESFTELTVICTRAGQWRKPNRQPRGLIQPDSSATTTKGRNQCTKTGHHERSKFRTWKFTNCMACTCAWTLCRSSLCSVRSTEPWHSDTLPA